MSHERMPDLTATSEPEPERQTPFGLFVDGLNSLGSLLILAVMLMMCADVVARDVFNNPQPGVAEMVGVSIVAILFLQLASTVRHGRMARADLFIDPFKTASPVGGSILEAVFHLMGTAMCLLVFYATLPVFLRAWRDSEFFGVENLFTFPTWPVRLIVLIGSTTAATQYLLLAWHDLRRAFRGNGR